MLVEEGAPLSATGGEWSEDAAAARDARREVARVLVRLDAFLNGRAGNQDLSKSILNAQRKQIAACKDELSRTEDDLNTAQEEAEEYCDGLRKHGLTSSIEPVSGGDGGGEGAA